MKFISCEAQVTRRFLDVARCSFCTGGAFYCFLDRNVKGQIIFRMFELLEFAL